MPAKTFKKLSRKLRQKGIDKSPLELAQSVQKKTTKYKNNKGLEKNKIERTIIITESVSNKTLTKLS